MITSRPLPHGNCYRVAPSLLAGEYPGAPTEEVGRAKVVRHLEAGVTVFLDLTEAAELVPYDHWLRAEAGARGLQVQHLRHPIRDQSVPGDVAQMTAILDAIDAAISAGKTVYVHCWGGIGRTGTVIGCWLVRHGHTGEGALEVLGQHWRGVEKVHRRPRSPETDEQWEYVRAWAARSSR